MQSLLDPIWIAQGLYKVKCAGESKPLLIALAFIAVSMSCFEHTLGKAFQIYDYALYCLG